MPPFDAVLESAVRRSIAASADGNTGTLSACAPPVALQLSPALNIPAHSIR